jgi:hypothetical protein
VSRSVTCDHWFAYSSEFCTFLKAAWDELLSHTHADPDFFPVENVNIARRRGESVIVPEDPRGILLEWSRLPPIVRINPPLVEQY